MIIKLGKKYTIHKEFHAEEVKKYRNDTPKTEFQPGETVSYTTKKGYNTVTTVDAKVLSVDASGYIVRYPDDTSFDDFSNDGVSFADSKSKMKKKKQMQANESDNLLIPVGAVITCNDIIGFYEDQIHYSATADYVDPETNTEVRKNIVFKKGNTPEEIEQVKSQVGTRVQNDPLTLTPEQARDIESRIEHLKSQIEFNNKRLNIPQGTSSTVGTKKVGDPKQDLSVPAVEPYSPDLPGGIEMDPKLYQVRKRTEVGRPGPEVLANRNAELNKQIQRLQRLLDSNKFESDPNSRFSQLELDESLIKHIARIEYRKFLNEIFEDEYDFFDRPERYLQVGDFVETTNNAYKVPAGTRGRIGKYSNLDGDYPGNVHIHWYDSDSDTIATPIDLDDATAEEFAQRGLVKVDINKGRK